MEKIKLFEAFINKSLKLTKYTKDFDKIINQLDKDTGGNARSVTYDSDDEWLNKTNYLKQFCLDLLEYVKDKYNQVFNHVILTFTSYPSIRAFNTLM